MFIFTDVEHIVTHDRKFSRFKHQISDETILNWAFTIDLNIFKKFGNYKWTVSDLEKLMPKQLKLAKLEKLDIVNEGVVTASRLRNIYSYSLIWHIWKFSHFYLFSFILLKYCVTFAVEFIITTRTHCHAWYRTFVGFSCSFILKSAESSGTQVYRSQQ